MIVKDEVVYRGQLGSISLRKATMEKSKVSRLALMITNRARAAGCALSLVVVGSSLTACSEQKVAAASPSQGATSSSESSIPEVLATIGDEKITLAELRTRAGDELDQMESRYQQTRHNLIDRTLQDMVRERVLNAEAKKQGKTVEELVAAEAGGAIEPSEVEMNAWYASNRARLGGRTFEQLRPQIADYLRKEKYRLAATKLDARLDKENRVAIYLEPYRVNLNNDGAPSMGPVNAPVTLVEFSDFQCPYCRTFFPTLKQVEEKYKDKVRIVYRQYPIASLHPFAPKAAEASLCANDQGKFWEMHDLMFQEQNQLAVKDLKVKAGRVAMDQKRFDSCLDTGKYAEKVQEDMREGSRFGVTGTPALFINGVIVEGGAVTFETLAALLDAEIARTSAK